MSRTRWSARAVAALLVGIGALGCAGQSGSAPLPPPIGAPSAAVPTSSAQPSPAEVEPAVRATFESYGQALLDRNGSAAAALVTTDTIEYYGTLATLASTGGPEEIGARSLTDRLSIALLRVRRTPAELAQMDGRRLFEYAVEAGLVDESSVANNQLGSIRVDGERALAQVVVGSTPSPFNYEFVREGDRWLFDIVSLIHATDPVLRQAARQAGRPEDELIFQLVESSTGQRVDASIFARP